MKNKTIIFLTIAFLLVPSLIYSQQLVQQIEAWRATLILVSRSVIGLAAIGGGVYTYFKVQADDGGSGKKAIGNYILALVFAALLQSIIEFFIV